MPMRLSVSAAAPLRMLHDRFHVRAVLLPLAVTLASALPAVADVTANAGPDRTARASTDCTSVVILDGAESLVVSDIEPTFTWEGPFSEGGGVVTGKLVMVTLEKGVHEIRLTVRAGDESDEDRATITVQDNSVPRINSVVPSMDVLWPPNHKMVPVELTVDVEDNCDDQPECEIVDITSSEPEDGRGDGYTSPDTEIAGPLVARLRAERSGGGSGRDYTINVRCQDRDGNVGAARAKVRVPTDQGLNRGKDADRCRLKVKFDDIGKCRMDLRLAIGDRQDLVPLNATKPRKDDLEGYEIALDLEGTVITGIIDRKGRIKTDEMRLTWSTSKRRFTISLRGHDLPALLDLDPTVAGRRIEVQTPARITLTGPEDGAVPLEVYEDVVGCEYKHTIKKPR